MPRPSRSATPPPGQTELEVVGDPEPEVSASFYSAADKAKLKAKVDSATAEVEELKRQIDLKKELLSDAVFDLKQAMGGKGFRDSSGTTWRFVSRGKENPTHYLQRVGSGDIEEL